MKILFLLLKLPLEGSGDNLYTDLISEFVKHGHQVTIMAPDEKHMETFIGQERGARVVRVKSLPTQNVRNLLKKAIGLALLPYYFTRAYKQYLEGEAFDWIFMPTPPITLIDFVSYVKKHTNAKFYLILRDIHPQSAASIGLIKYKFMYDYLAGKANKGYKLADIIGCMSQGNIDFIATNYPDIDRRKLTVLMNWQRDTGYTPVDMAIRCKFGLENKCIILFGGTIGYGQRIENVILLAKLYKGNDNVVFLVVGRGVEKKRLEKLAQDMLLTNIKFIDFLPRDEYIELVKNADIGLISINEKYKVPTCPSKIVSYMSQKIPVFAMINPDNDYGQIIDLAGMGYWVDDANPDTVKILLDKMISDESLRKSMGESGYVFYKKHLTSDNAYYKIMTQIYHEC